MRRATVTLLTTLVVLCIGASAPAGLISSFEVSANPDIASTTETVLLTLTQPNSNHNGGHLEFGHDGYMYLSMGDGAGEGWPEKCQT